MAAATSAVRNLKIEANEDGLEVGESRGSAAVQGVVAAATVVPIHPFRYSQQVRFARLRSLQRNGNGDVIVVYLKQLIREDPARRRTR